MRIYFKDISYQNFPVVFSIDSGGKSAKCLYSLAGSKITVSKEDLNTQLIKIEGIELVENTAIIKDIDVFRKQYPLSTLIDTSEQALLANTIFAQSLPTIPTVEAKLDKEVSTSVSATTLNSPELLSLDEVLANCPGDTLVYEGRLKQNNDISLERLSALKIHSLDSMNLTNQVIKNMDYYLLRLWQMQLIRQIHEEIIAPSISTFNQGRTLPKSVIEHFESMIKNVMLNAKYNIHDTAFEMNLEQVVPIEENYAIRTIYARSMLQGYLYFTNDFHIDKLNLRNPELKQWLERFKAHVAIHKPKLEILISHLLKITISVGLMDHDYRKLTEDSFLQGENYDFSVLHTKTKALQLANTTLAYSLGQLDQGFQLPPHSAAGIPHRVFSLCQILKYSLDSFLIDNNRQPLSDHGKEELINSVLDTVKQRLISATQGNVKSNAAKLISHTLKTSDKDIYLCDEWSKAINSALHDISVKSLSLLSPRREAKYVDRWKQEVENSILGFINRELEKQHVLDVADTIEQVHSPRG